MLQGSKELIGLTNKLFNIKEIAYYNNENILCIFHGINEDIRIYRESVESFVKVATLISISESKEKAIIVDCDEILESGIGTEEDEIIEFKKYVLVDLEGEIHRLYGEILENEDILNEIQNKLYLNYEKTVDDYGIKDSDKSKKIDVIISSCPDSFYDKIRGQLILFENN